MNDANCSVELSTAWTLAAMINTLDLDELEAAVGDLRRVTKEEKPDSNVVTLTEASRDKPEAWRSATADHPTDPYTAPCQIRISENCAGTWSRRKA